MYKGEQLKREGNLRIEKNDVTIKKSKTKNKITPLYTWEIIEKMEGYIWHGVYLWGSLRIGGSIFKTLKFLSSTYPHF